MSTVQSKPSTLSLKSLEFEQYHRPSARNVLYSSKLSPKKVFNFTDIIYHQQNSTQLPNNPKDGLFLTQLQQTEEQKSKVLTRKQTEASRYSTLSNFTSIKKAFSISSPKATEISHDVPPTSLSEQSPQPIIVSSPPARIQQQRYMTPISPKSPMFTARTNFYPNLTSSKHHQHSIQLDQTLSPRLNLSTATDSERTGQYHNKHVQNLHSHQNQMYLKTKQQLLVSKHLAKGNLQINHSANSDNHNHSLTLDRCVSPRRTINKPDCTLQYFKDSKEQKSKQQHSFKQNQVSNHHSLDTFSDQKPIRDVHDSANFSRFLRFLSKNNDLNNLLSAQQNQQQQQQQQQDLNQTNEQIRNRSTSNLRKLKSTLYRLQPQNSKESMSSALNCTTDRSMMYIRDEFPSNNNDNDSKTILNEPNNEGAKLISSLDSTRSQQSSSSNIFNLMTRELYFKLLELVEFANNKKTRIESLLRQIRGFTPSISRLLFRDGLIFSSTDFTFEKLIASILLEQESSYSSSSQQHRRDTESQGSSPLHTQLITQRTSVSSFQIPSAQNKQPNHEKQKEIINIEKELRYYLKNLTVWVTERNEGEKNKLHNSAANSLEEIRSILAKQNKKTGDQVKLNGKWLQELKLSLNVQANKQSGKLQINEYDEIDENDKTKNTHLPQFMQPTVSIENIKYWEKHLGKFPLISEHVRLKDAYITDMCKEYILL